MTDKIKSISIIGSGNVAFHLGKAFSGLVKINAVYSRNKSSAQELADELFVFHAENIRDLIPSDIFLVCTSDDSISAVIDSIPIDQAIVYTSGSVGISELPTRNNLGVLYPLQTFSKRRLVDLFEVPFFIEGTTESFAQAIFDLAWQLSRKVIFANSNDRKNLHLAAVMVNNFSNHIAFLSQRYLNGKSLEWDFLKPLILETAKKLQSESPFDAQTGPAMRGDQKTIEKQLSMLDEETKNIYTTLSASITRQHKK
jgi:predicted short-subunit dehydrogenase-like oxidoreductase (DUF2520 family)